MKHQVTLTIASLLASLLFSLHWADEVARGRASGMLSVVLPVRALGSLRRAGRGPGE